MRVRIFAPAWCKADGLDERGWADLPAGSTLTDALAFIRMPRAVARLLHASVNGETTTLDTALKDGDVVGFFSIMSGG